MFRKLSLAAIALSVSFVLAMSPITLPKAYADSGVSGVSASQNEFVERLLIELTNIEISVDDTPDMIRIKYETATIEFVYVNCFSDKGTVDLETFKGFLEEAPKFDPKKKGMDEFIEFAGSLDYGRILDLLGTSVTLLQNVEDLVNLVTHIEGFSDGRMSIIEKTTVLDGLRSIYAIAGDVAGYVPLVGPLLSIPFDVGEKAVGFVQEVTDKIFARYFDYLKLEVLIRINAVGSDGNPIGTFGKGDRLAINEAAIRAGLGASSDVAQKLAEVKDTLGLTIRLRDVMGYYRSIHRSSYGTTAALDESIESVDGQIAHLNECIQVLSICQILQETEEECKDTDKVVGFISRMGNTSTSSKTL